MTGLQADQLGRKLGIHLRRNEFGVCREIIDAVEQEFRQRPRRPDADGVAIAESGLDLRLVNLLEKEGYLYVGQLQGVDLDGLRQRCSQLGSVGVRAIRGMIQRVRTGEEQRGPRCAR